MKTVIFLILVLIQYQAYGATVDSVGDDDDRPLVLDLSYPHSVPLKQAISAQQAPKLTKNSFSTGSLSFDFDHRAQTLVWLERLGKIELLEVEGLHLVDLQTIQFDHRSSERLQTQYRFHPYRQAVLIVIHYHLF